MKMKFALALAASLSILFASATASAAALYTTVGAPPSSLLLEVIVGDPGGEDFLVVGTLGPLSITGLIEADVDVDGNGDGGVTFLGALLAVQNGSTTIDLGDPDEEGLGTVDITLQNVGLGFSSSLIAVLLNQWGLDVDPPTSFDFALNDGLIILDNATGPIAGLLGEDVILDLSTDPLTLNISQLLGFGIGGTAEDEFVSLVVPGAYQDIGADLLGIPDLFFVRLTVEVNAVLVPEPSSMALLGLGLAGVGAYGFRRRRLRK